jgi:hypothetical protein
MPRDVRARENTEFFREVNRHTGLDGASDKLLALVCACSELGSRAPLDLTVDEFQLVRETPEHSIVVPDHIDSEYERVVGLTGRYAVVTEPTSTKPLPPEPRRRPRLSELALGAELLDDRVAVVRAHDALELRDDVVGKHEKVVRVRPDLSVLVGRQVDRLGAVRAAALAHERRRLGRVPRGFKLLDPLVQRVESTLIVIAPGCARHGFAHDG